MKVILGSSSAYLNDVYAQLHVTSIDTDSNEQPHGVYAVWRVCARGTEDYFLYSYKRTNTDAINVQPRVPCGKYALEELPAGMLDASVFFFLATCLSSLGRIR